MESARDEILGRLRKTQHPLPEKPDFKAPVYHSIEEPPELFFEKSLTLVNGKVWLCKTEQEFSEQLKSLVSAFNPGTVFCNEPEINELLNKNGISALSGNSYPETIEAGITGCEFLIAHTGSIMVSSAQQGGRQLFVYPPVHIVVARKNQLVGFLEEAYSKITQKYNGNMPSQISIITGPSRTADIEKTLTLGAHGPKELHVFIY